MSFDLCHPIDAGGLVEVAHAIQQRQLNAGDLGKVVITLYSVEMIGLIELGEGLGRLIEKLDAVGADLEIPQLFGRNHLKDHGGLVR